MIVRTTKTYCERCECEVDVEEHFDGPTVVRCPSCVGECSSCQCPVIARRWCQAPGNVVAEAPKVTRGHL